AWEDAVRIVYEREADVDRGRGLVLVFDLRLRQRRLVRGTPVDRLQAPVDGAGLRQVTEDLDDLGLEFRGERQIGMLPVATDAQAPELLPLLIDPLQGVFPAAAADLQLRRLLLLAKKLQGDIALDRHPVVVPARHVGGPEAV